MFHYEGPLLAVSASTLPSIFGINTQITTGCNGTLYCPWFFAGRLVNFLHCTDSNRPTPVTQGKEHGGLLHIRSGPSKNLSKVVLTTNHFHSSEPQVKNVMGFDFPRKSFQH